MRMMMMIDAFRKEKREMTIDADTSSFPRKKDPSSFSFFSRELTTDANRVSDVTSTRLFGKSLHHDDAVPE
jgi:hypothetical protein